MAMASEIALRVINLAGDLVSQTVKWAITRKSPAEKNAEVKEPATSEKAIRVVVSHDSSPRLSSETGVKIAMPTTEDTIFVLKQRLATELYRVELDLQSGARILSKPCDCLGRNKHGGALVAMAGELMSYETNPVYGDVISWYDAHEPEFDPASILKHDPAYYRAMTPEVRDLRKRLNAVRSVPSSDKTGTSPITLEDAKRIASEEATKKVEDLWKSGKEVSTEVTKESVAAPNAKCLADGTLIQSVVKRDPRGYHGQVYVYVGGCKKPRSDWESMPNDGYLYWSTEIAREEGHSPDTAKILDTVITERYRRRGLASHLVKEAESSMSKVGVRHIYGHDTSGTVFWTKLGYQMDSKFNISKDL